MRFVPVITIGLLAAIALAAAWQASSPSAQAIGTPSTLPFHQRLPSVARDGAAGVAESDIAAAQARWARNGGLNYRITVSWVTYGYSERHTLYVTGGAVGNFESDCAVAGEPAACGQINYAAYTVPGLFATLAQQIARQAASDSEAPGTFFVRARYHQDYGYPVEFSFGLRLIPDSAQGWRIEDLQLIY